MTRAMLRSLMPGLAVALLAATPARPVGFADLTQLAASHPLHAVLLEYDREIAALQSTRSVAGLRDPAWSARNAAAAVRRDAETAQWHVRQIAARANRYRAVEGAVLAAVLASRDGGETRVQTYADALTRETNASFRTFEGGIAQRNARAYAARAQQLREKELTLAFDLARQNGGTRLRLRLKLEDLHLAASARATLRAKLAALDAAELRAVNALQRRNAAILSSYWNRLRSQGELTDAQMAAELRRKADANFAIRRSVAQTESHSADALRDLPAAIAVAARYAPGADASKIAGGMRAASQDLSARFAELAASAARSDRETAAQIRTLAANRAALYRSIVGEIIRKARIAAQRRHCASVTFSGPRPTGSVDLTPELRVALTRS